MTEHNSNRRKTSHAHKVECRRFRIGFTRQLRQIEKHSRTRRVVPGTNLTHAEAQERSAHIETIDYAIAIDLTRGDETFHTVTTVRFRAAAGSSTFIDAITRSVTSVTLNDVSLDPQRVS